MLIHLIGVPNSWS